MRKIILALMTATVLVTFILFNSCKKETSPQPSSNSAIIEKIKTWLDEQKKGKLPKKVANIDLLKSNLNFANLHFEQLGSDEQLLIIPITDDFKTKGEIDKNAIPDLVLFMNSAGNIRSANIALYTPADGDSRIIPDNTFYNIFNTARPESNGKFQFLAVTGTPQYELAYKNKRLVSSGTYQSKEKSAASDRTMICYDWYLVTTWYDLSGGVIDKSYAYLYTTCGDCASNPKLMSFCAGDGGSAPAECCISDPTAKLSSIPIGGDPGLDKCGIETVDPITKLHTKTCTHSWYFVTNNLSWYIWKYGSVEEGEEVKEGNTWKFTSVKHDGLLTDGVVPPCVTANCNIASAIGSFSGNTARMNLIYSQNITLVCKTRGGLISKSSSASTQWVVL